MMRKYLKKNEEWKEENIEVIDRETSYMINMGYEGDVVNKMYKSARYYFKNKSTEKTKPEEASSIYRY